MWPEGRRLRRGRALFLRLPVLLRTPASQLCRWRPHPASELPTNTPRSRCSPKHKAEAEMLERRNVTMQRVWSASGQLQGWLCGPSELIPPLLPSWVCCLMFGTLDQGGDGLWWFGSADAKCRVCEDMQVARWLCNYPSKTPLLLQIWPPSCYHL